MRTWAPLVRVTARTSSAGYGAGGVAAVSGPAIGREERGLLDGPGSQARDVVVEEEDVEDDDGHRTQDGARHQLPPEVDVAADQLARDADAGRDLVGGRREGQRVDKLVPRQGEGEERGADEPLHRNLQHDA